MNQLKEMFFNLLKEMQDTYGKVDEAKDIRDVFSALEFGINDSNLQYAKNLVDILYHKYIKVQILIDSYNKENSDRTIYQIVDTQLRLAAIVIVFKTISDIENEIQNTNK